MTKDEKDIILKRLIEERNYYEGECRRRMAEEYGKIKGADYVIQKFHDHFKTEESEVENDT